MISVAPGDVLTGIDGHDVSGYPKSLLRRIFAQSKDTQVSLDMLRQYQDGREVEYQIEIARDTCQVLESHVGHDVNALESEALRMQINLLRDDAEQNGMRLRETQEALSEARSSLLSDQEAMRNTKMLLIAANEQVSDHREETEWLRAQLADASVCSSKLDVRATRDYREFIVTTTEH